MARLAAPSEAFPRRLQQNSCSGRLHEPMLSGWFQTGLCSDGRHLTDSSEVTLGDVAVDLHERHRTESLHGALVIGTTDERLYVDRVNPGSEGLIGYGSAEVLGQSILALVDEATAGDLLEAFEEASTSGHGASRTVVVRGKDGDMLRCEAVVVALLPPPSCAFAFIPEGSPMPIVSTAEQRFAVQIGQGMWGPVAAQILSDLPGLDQLTTRELGIVRFLVAGDRVRSISQHLFLSQSTVRSHLSTIFGKFGVRSQQELLDLLRVGAATDDGSG